MTHTTAGLCAQTPSNYTVAIQYSVFFKPTSWKNNTQVNTFWANGTVYKDVHTRENSHKQPTDTTHVHSLSHTKTTTGSCRATLIFFHVYRLKYT